MKIALGLFHFNIQYVAGDQECSHRYCLEAVWPFLRLLEANPRYRVSFEMAGNGLEFVARHYPDALALLQALVRRNQVELISSTYTPAVWVAFPGRDLLRSVAINRRALAALELEAADVFFAQEGFFGPGIRALSGEFSAALCKDDYLGFFVDPPEAGSGYRLGQVKVVVGSNHLLNELNRRRRRAGPHWPPSGFHRQRLANAEGSLAAEPGRSAGVAAGGTEWHWYHMGSGHHFTTPASPEEWESFHYDPAWAGLNMEILDGLIENGYALGHVGEFARALSLESLPAMPLVPEGSWNARKSLGVHTWMGRQENAWENGPGILGLAWRARSALRGLEEETGAEPAAGGGDEAWRKLLLAESSDPLGWRPLPCEARFGKECAEAALRACGGSSRGPARLRPQDPAEPSARCAQGPEGAPAREAPVQVEWVGAEGILNWSPTDDGAWVCDARFRATEAACGVRFRREGAAVEYCPSGLEGEAAGLDPTAYKPESIYLPLANGLVGLGSGRYLIRCNKFGQVAARVRKNDPWVEFSVKTAPKLKWFQWRFVAMRGGLAQAVRLANSINQA